MLHDTGNEFGGGGQNVDADDGQTDFAAFSDIIAEIRYWHRQRCFAMEQRKRVDLALGAFLRTALGWSKALPEAERKKIAAQAKALIDLAEKEKKGKDADTDEPAYHEWRDVIGASLAARDPFDAVEARAKKEMERLAKSLPVWEAWAKDVRGFGAGSLAVIVGEAGDLSGYSTDAKLWKRMGVAVLDGVRQGGLSKGASKDDWIAHGYSPMRRSRMWNIGDTLIKGGERYREIYLARKEIEREKAAAAGLTVCPSAKIPKGRAAEFMSDGHIHRRAQRYMEKRLLRHLWRAWRARAGLPETAIEFVPATKHTIAAE